MLAEAPAARLQAVLFDMDGLLVDTEPQWYAAELDTVHLLGGTWGPENHRDLLGSNLAVAAAYMLAHTGSSESAVRVEGWLEDAMTRQLEQAVTPQPGAVALVRALRGEGVPIALVSSSVRAHIKAVLSCLPDLVFDASVGGDEVRRLKPDPEPYLTACALLDVDPARCVVLEDSPPGVAAGAAAGCRVIAVPSVVPIEPAPGRLVVTSLTEVTPGLLRAQLS
jgi:HAD superfamily hydrolase (TIGR01509 family)